MLYRISVAERGLTGIANIFRSRLSGLDDLLRAGTVPLIMKNDKFSQNLASISFGRMNIVLVHFNDSGKIFTPACHLRRQEEDKHINPHF